MAYGGDVAPQQSTSIVRQSTAASSTKAAPALFEQLGKAVKADGENLSRKVKGVVLFKIDNEEWTLDLSEGGKGDLYQGPPKEKPDLTLTMSDENFAKLVMGKLSAQQAFLLRKLKLSGSMGMAMKLTPVLEAAQPKAKM